MTTKATPLSAVKTTREASSLRVLMASFSSLVMLRVCNDFKPYHLSGVIPYQKLITEV